MIEPPVTGPRNEAASAARVPVRVPVGRWLQLAADGLVLAGAFGLAYELRFEFTLPGSAVTAALHQAPYVVALQIAALQIVGARALIWRYVGMAELPLFVKAACLSALPILMLRLWLPQASDVWRVPLSVLVMCTVFGFGGALGLRVLHRALREAATRRLWAAEATRPARSPVLLIGAGSAGVLTAKEIQADTRTALEIRGFVDDDPNLQGRPIQGVRVLGTTRDLPRLVRELGIESVVISIVADEPTGVGLSRRNVRRIRDICESIPVKVRIVPTIHELLTNNVTVSQIRDIQIEDLLGREPVQLETRAIRRLLEAKTVLVTGAGGSIGCELVRQVARFGPSRLVLVERAEPALFTVDRELRSSFGGLTVAPVVGDVGDAGRMRALFETYAPDVVLHAAAHKHVPLMELNPGEAIANNVLATRRLGELAGEAGVGVFVLISSDKAVRPTSIMGASKRLAEIVVQGLNERFATRYMAVRFGNVIGSTGSVIPIFRDQIQKGGPVTVTHPKMMRYFMTIPEAAQLVLQAAALGEGSEIFILDMGEPVNILALAMETIRLSGLEPFQDVDIEFIGPRAGEKLVEELHLGDEAVVRTRHPKILIGRITAYKDSQVREALRQLAVLSASGSERELRAYINAFLPEADLAVAAAPGSDRGRKLQPAPVFVQPVPRGIEAV